jgi:hypothetical protein
VPWSADQEVGVPRCTRVPTDRQIRALHERYAPTSASAYASALGRFGADKPARFDALRRRFGEPDLAPLAREYGHRLS